MTAAVSKSGVSLSATGAYTQRCTCVWLGLGWGFAGYLGGWGVALDSGILFYVITKVLLAFNVYLRSGFHAIETAWKAAGR